MSQPNFSKLKNDATNIATRLLGFNVDFYDQVKFKHFVDNYMVELFSCYDEICISGHFSEGFAELICPKLEGVRKNLTLRLITKGHGVKTVNSLRKIQDAGAEVRWNDKTHFRMFVGTSTIGGVLLLGSFDFNKEGMSRERRDVGIYTTHPDLVQSAYEYFMNVWNEERDSIPLDEKFPDDRKIAKEQNTPEPEPSLIVGSKSSLIYHLPSCEYVTSISRRNRIVFKSKLLAQTEGYNPCKVCKPGYS